VLGVGLVGQLAVQFLALQGGRVVALDYDAGRLALAKAHGAELAWNLGEPGAASSVAALTDGIGCDAVLIAAATESSEPLEVAAELARDRARVVMVGKTGTNFPYAAFMKKELSITVSRSYGPGRYDDEFENRGVKYPVGFVRWTETENLREVVRLMSRGLDVAPLVTHRFRFEDAERAYELVTGGGEPHLGVVLGYEERARAPRPSFPAPRQATGGCTLGVIGAGAFARTVLLPELGRMKDVTLRTIVTQRGMTAEHARRQFKFERCATELDAVLGDPSINAVLIATRHASHAELTARALEAGKSVLVEKPLAVDEAGIARVLAARERSPGFFLVGFNRRFAPMVATARQHLGKLPGPKFLLLRVNAGALPNESWINAAEEGGGRIVGELCHFVDLARMLAGSAIVSVDAAAAGRDDLSVSLNFADGSLATIAYTSLGDTSFSKERFEAFAGGSVVTIDNFLALTITADGRARTEKASQDKGHAAELAAFVKGVAEGRAPVDEAELAETSRATLAVLDSLREGRRIAL
jgi:predicted dehydrogenase